MFLVVDTVLEKSVYPMTKIIKSKEQALERLDTMRKACFAPDGDGLDKLKRNHPDFIKSLKSGNNLIVVEV